MAGLPALTAISDTSLPRPSIRGLRPAGVMAVVPPLVLVLAAAWWVFGHMAERPGAVFHSYDVYNAYYPNAVYALRSLREGHGLLWMSLQNCGQPFLPATLLGPFYPLNLVYLLFDVSRGISVIAFLHLLVGGLATYLLGREIGLGRTGSLCGAIGFQMGSHLLSIAGWLPVTIMGSYVWLPLALLLCERILRAPGLGAGLGLGIVLTFSVLGAYPQMTVFIYELVLLRVTFEMIVPGGRSLRAAAGALALAFALPLALGAVQLVPAAEFALHSIRGRTLDPNELAWPSKSLVTWADLRKDLALRAPNFGHGLPITFAALAPLAFVARGTRRQAIFHALVVLVFTALATDSPLLRLYLWLPFGSIFRMPGRFVWVASFGACMLTALGADAIARPGEGRRVPLPLLVLLGAAVLWLIAGTLPPTRELWVVAGLVAVAAVATVPSLARRLRTLMTVAMPLLIGGFALRLSWADPFTYTDWGGLLAKDASVLDFLRTTVTAEDRFYAVAPQARSGLAEKTASVFGVPSISDYEPQTSQRFAELDVLLRTNGRMRTMNDFGLRLTRAPRNRRILDLLATRYLVVVQNQEPLDPALQGSLRTAAEFGDVVVYENAQAFHRAFYVPTASVVADPESRLQSLGSGPVDLRLTVLLEGAPPDGFLGTPGARGEARIEEDRSESVRVHVHADAPGFLVLTDQDYPGWRATVNDVPVPTLRANHAFRAVAVPAGDSTVVWTYRPTSVLLGLTISLVTFAAVGVVFVRARS